MSASVLAATGVSFGYRRWLSLHPVFTDFSWEVAPGAVTLLLGPNGAGKSTLLKLLAGFERPQSGAIGIGNRVDRSVLYDLVGWMPQDVQPVRGLSVIEQLEYAAWVGGESRRRSRELAAVALRDVNLVDLQDARTDRLSGGQLRRLGLGQAIVRRPKILLLDEPMAGLDPAQAASFRTLLARLECPGGIVVSTHQIADLADDVDRVAVLAGGRLRFDGSVTEMHRIDGERSIADVFTRMVGGGDH